MMIRIVILISGAGSNLQAIVDAARKKKLAAEVVAVFSNRTDAGGLQFAESSGIPAFTLSSNKFSDRKDYEHSLSAAIDEFRPDLVLLAGFMRILGTEFVAHYCGRLLNIHPSLLPLYPGLDTHRRALEDKASSHGCSVHFVTDKLDGGPVILQGKVIVEPNADEKTLRQQVQQLEHQIYPKVVQWIAEGRLRYSEDKAWLDDKQLPPNGYQCSFSNNSVNV